MKNIVRSAVLATVLITMAPVAAFASLGGGNPPPPPRSSASAMTVDSLGGGNPVPPADSVVSTPSSFAYTIFTMFLREFGF